MDWLEEEDVRPEFDPEEEQDKADSAAEAWWEAMNDK